MMNFPPVFVMAWEFSESKLCFSEKMGQIPLSLRQNPARSTYDEKSKNPMSRFCRTVLMAISTR